MSKIKTLIMDAGGVLVRPIHGDWNIPVKYRELLGEYAKDVGSESWRSACAAEAEYLREGRLVADTNEEYALRMQFLEAVAGRMGWKLSSQTLQALTRDFTYNTDRHAFYGDVAPRIAELSENFRIGILSDAMPSLLDVIDNSTAREYFEKIVISSSLGFTKPDARMFAAICNAMDAAPQDCLFVDDKPCNLEGAIAFGMQAVQMRREGFADWSCVSDWNGGFVRDLSELKTYAEGLN